MGMELLESLDEAQRRGIETLGRKALALERLLAIGQEISTLDLATALRRILHHVLELTGTRRGAVLLAEEKEGLRVELAVNLEGELAGEGFAVSRSVAARALATGEVIVVEEAQAPASEYREQPSIVELGLRALLAIPLKTRERTLGVLYLDTDSPRHAVRDLDRSVLAAFGSQAAIALDNARLYQSLQDDYFLLRRSVEESFRFENILYRSPAMHRVCEAIRQVAASDVTVLIQGETGTGKELVARAIHFNSAAQARAAPRASNCRRPAGQPPGKRALRPPPRGLLRRTGAQARALRGRRRRHRVPRRDRRGLGRRSRSPAAPAGDRRPSGGWASTADRRADVRVLAATHRDLEEEVRSGRFRADLYYRLSVFPIRLPPLRERREDIELLVHCFVERFNRELGRSVRSIPRSTLSQLLERDWPGNVRELQNVIQRLVLLSPGEELAGLDDQPAAGPTASLPAAQPLDSPPPRTLEEVERDHILTVLAQAGGNQSVAARLLGLKRGTLRWRLKKLGIES